MNKLESNFLRPSIASNLLAGLMVVHLITLGDRIFPEFLPAWWHLVFGIMTTGIYVYVWLTFWEVLRQQNPNQRIGPFIPIMIAFLVYNQVVYAILEIQLPIWFSTPIWILSVMVYLAFGVRVLVLPDPLFGLKTSYAVSLIVVHIIDLFVYQVMYRYFFDLATDSYGYVTLISGLLYLVNLVLMYQILVRARNQGAHSKGNHLNDLIGTIGQDTNEG